MECFQFQPQKKASSWFNGIWHPFAFWGLEVHMKHVIYFVPFHSKNMLQDYTYENGRGRAERRREKNHVENNSTKISLIESFPHSLNVCVLCNRLVCSITRTHTQNTPIHSKLPSVCSMHGERTSFCKFYKLITITVYDFLLYIMCVFCILAQNEKYVFSAFIKM